MIDQKFVDEILTIAVGESKVYYLAQWAMSAMDGARAQRFEEIADEVVRKIECSYNNKKAIARELQEYYERMASEG